MVRDVLYGKVWTSTIKLVESDSQGHQKRKLYRKKLLSNSLEPFLTRRLTQMNQNPGLRPIRVE